MARGVHCQSHLGNRQCRYIGKVAPYRIRCEWRFRSRPSAVWPRPCPARPEARRFRPIQIAARWRLVLLDPVGDHSGPRRHRPHRFPEGPWALIPTRPLALAWTGSSHEKITFWSISVDSIPQSRNTLQRTITFQGQTFEAGLQTQGQLNALFISPGYQYDIIRRKRGHLGIGVHFNTFDTSAKISAQAQVTGDGTHYDAKSASGSFWAPIPVAGPQYRVYLTNSPRLFVEGDLYGMYFFGYGNYIRWQTASAIP